LTFSGGKSRQVFYPFEHIWVGGEEFHQLVGSAQAHCLLAEVHQFAIVDGATHILVNLGQLSNLLLDMLTA